ncbi:IscS subfamily cysteine desulfurase [Alkalimarinus alittae]|uniref:Cysteine desulfurase IscS n=1 Tax=Alkalimarinus alittae TaxID=2961619 RepID=A0ABY6N6J5_9ALTE|nr:IscS subfamily cysteine desulfurase [Alkalimarinus alittae]UZE97709.1 IscS subfamily cysteine desulfurase [Alkalimarinus alittae]
MSSPIYLDYAATTPVDVRVAEKMMNCLTMGGVFGNPASRSHIYGWQAESAVENARKQVASLINCDPREIVWTSGATESDNLAIKGVAEAYRDQGRHIITSSIEHKAVLDSCAYLETEGFDVTYLKPGVDGLIRPEHVKAALKKETVLVTLMHVNNEIGVITDIETIGEITKEAGVLFHVDAAQSAGKIGIDLQKVNVDFMSFSAHKLYGPKGVGALFVRRQPNVSLQSQIHGGGHERGMRSGTLPTHQIVGMGEAFRIAKESMADECKRISLLREKLWSGLKTLGGVSVNGDLECRVSSNLNVAFEGVDGESLMLALKDIAVSSGSACASASLDPSYVLKGIGVSDELAHASIRISLGRYTSEEDVDRALDVIGEKVQKLREISGTWKE